LWYWSSDIQNIGSKLKEARRDKQGFVNSATLLQVDQTVQMLNEYILFINIQYAKSENDHVNQDSFDRWNKQMTEISQYF